MTLKRLLSVFTLAAMFAVSVVWAEPQPLKIAPAVINTDPDADLTVKFMVTGKDLTKAEFKGIVDKDGKAMTDPVCQLVNNTSATQLVFTCKVAKGWSGEFFPVIAGNYFTEVGVRVTNPKAPAWTTLSSRLVTSKPDEEMSATFVVTGKNLKGAAVTALDSQNNEIKDKCKVADNSSPTRTEFTCQIGRDEKGIFWPQVAGESYDNLSITVRTKAEADFAAVQANAAAAAKKAKELEVQLAAQAKANSDLKAEFAKLASGAKGQEELRAKLAALETAQANLQNSVQEGLNRAQSSVEQQVAAARSEAAVAHTVAAETKTAVKEVKTAVNDLAVATQRLAEKKRGIFRRPTDRRAAELAAGARARISAIKID